MNIRNVLAGALVLTGLLVVSCRKDPNPPPPPPPPVDNCNTLAKVRLVDCQGQPQYVLELEDKTILEVYGLPAGFQLRENTCVRIGYNDKIKPVSRCNGRPAIITCIREVPCPDPADNCNVLVKAQRSGNVEGCPLLLERLDNHTLLEPVGGFNSVNDFQDGQLYLVGYKNVYLARASICMVPTVMLTCKRVANTTN